MLSRVCEYFVWMCLSPCTGVMVLSPYQIAAKIQPTGQKRPLEETESGMDRAPGMWQS